jgi:hypothetical protein
MGRFVDPAPGEPADEGQAGHPRCLGYRRVRHEPHDVAHQTPAVGLGYPWTAGFRNREGCAQAKEPHRRSRDRSVIGAGAFVTGDPRLRLQGYYPSLLSPGHVRPNHSPARAFVEFSKPCSPLPIGRLADVWRTSGGRLDRANQDLAVLGPVGRSDQSASFHHFDDARSAVVSEPELSLQP